MTIRHPNEGFRGARARAAWALALLAAAAGCDCGGTTDDPGACTTATDCPVPGSLCVDGRCVVPDAGLDVETDGPSDDVGPDDAPGETCLGAWCDGVCCDAGELCVDRACCPTGSICGGACCGTDQVCEDGICRLDCGERTACGDECCADDEVCHAGGCTVPGDPCDDPYDCPADMYCEPTIGRCLPRSGIDTTCEYRPPPGVFEPAFEWTWTGSTVLPSHNQVMMQPIVVQLTDDNGDTRIDQHDVPDILFHTYAGSNYSTDGVMRAVSGDGSGEIFTVSDPAYRTVGGSSIAAGDFDGDGLAEIVTCSQSNGVIAFEHDGTFTWHAAGGPLCRWTAPALADLEGDGTVEVIVGRAVLEGLDGRVRWSDPIDAVPHPEAHFSTAADLDGDGVLEVAAGTKAYRADGSVMWDLGLPSGYPAIADLDLDTLPDVVMVQSLGGGADWTSRGHWLRALRGADGSTLWGPVDLNQGRPTPSGPGGGGPPTVSDFDGDTRPEVAAAGGYGYVVFNGEDGSPLWFTETVDLSSRVTGSSVFDFEGDGAAEVVYGDEHNLRIYDGRDGTELFRVCNVSGTLWEYPVIVDVDNDDHAEIVVARNNYTGWRCDDGTAAPTGIAVIGDASNNWVRTRRVWNQHTYHVTNVGEDGSIPSSERPNWAVPGLNNFRQNVQPEGLFAAPDLVVARVVIDESPCSDHLAVAAWIENRGGGGAPAGIPIAFYEGDPEAGGTLVGVVPTAVPILPGASIRVPIDWPVGDARVGESIPIFVRIDDDGTGAPIGWLHECRTGNNAHGPTEGRCPRIG